MIEVNEMYPAKFQREKKNLNFHQTISASESPKKEHLQIANPKNIDIIT